MKRIILAAALLCPMAANAEEHRDIIAICERHTEKIGCALDKDGNPDPMVRYSNSWVIKQCVYIFEPLFEPRCEAIRAHDIVKEADRERAAEAELAAAKALQDKDDLRTLQEWLPQ